MSIAYAVAHNVGRHVQNLLGTLSKVAAAQHGASQADANRLSPMLEFQSACFAGVWAHEANSRGLLEVGDLDGLLAAATEMGGEGSPDERANWFRRGYEQGSLDGCDTFGSRE